MDENHWYHRARTGLFVSYGINSGNQKWPENNTVPYNTIEEFEETSKDFDAQAWVDAAKKIRAGYINFDTFHSCLGYIKAWRSEIPGTFTTKRDYLQEVIDAAKAEDIRVIVYISGDPGAQGYNDNYPWLDAKAYAKYKGQEGLDIEDMHTWQAIYCKEVIGELMQNYPDLAGFWYDGWNERSTAADVFGYVHSINPEVINVRNDFHECPSFPDEDVMSIEQFGKVCDPPEDFVNASWLEPGGAECSYVLDDLCDWWYRYDPKPDYDKNLYIRKTVALIANGWVAKIGMGPDIDGKFVGANNDMLDDFDKFFTYAQPTLWDTQPGGLAQGKYNGGAYGVTTCRPDKEEYYIHLFHGPKGGTLIVPDGGLLVREAINVYDGSAVNFSQQNGEIHLRADFDKYTNIDGDMIIKLTARQKETTVFNIEGDIGAAFPRDITIDLGQCKEVCGMILTETETSAMTFGGWGAPDNARLKDYEVYTSEDGLYFTLVQTGTLEGVRGRKQLNFAKTGARYLRLRQITAQDTAEAFVKKHAGLFWQKVDTVKSMAIANNGMTYTVDSFDTLWQDNGGAKVRIAEGVQSVVRGRDDRLYYAVPEGRVICHPGMDTGVVASRFAVDKQGAIYYVHGGDLYKGDLKLQENVHDVDISPEGKLCLAGNGYLDIGGDRWETDLNIRRIAVGRGMTILDDKGHVYGVTQRLQNPYRITVGAEDIFCDEEGSVYVLTGRKTGTNQIKTIQVL